MKRGLSVGIIAKPGYQAQFVKSHPWDQRPDDEVKMNPIIPYFDPILNKRVIPELSK